MNTLLFKALLGAAGGVVFSVVLIDSEYKSIDVLNGVNVMDAFMVAHRWAVIGALLAISKEILLFVLVFIGILYRGLLKLLGSITPMRKHYYEKKMLHYAELRNNGAITEHEYNSKIAHLRHLAEYD